MKRFEIPLQVPPRMAVIQRDVMKGRSSRRVRWVLFAAAMLGLSTPIMQASAAAPRPMQNAHNSARLRAVLNPLEPVGHGSNKSRVVVVVGTVGSRVPWVNAGMTRALREQMVRILKGIDGARIVDPSDLAEISQTVPRLRVDASMVEARRRIERETLSIRCELSVVLTRSDDRALIGSLRGTATGQLAVRGAMGQAEVGLLERTASRALESALQNAGRAILSAQ